jgi:hypothetical protein
MSHPALILAAARTRTTVHIGLKYTGKYAGHMDTTTGTYWEALPKIEGDALKIQRSLIKHATRVKTPPALPGLHSRYAKLLSNFRK